MGDIADMMLDGTLDCETGEYIGPGDGYPRTLEGGGVFEGHSRQERQGEKAARRAAADASFAAARTLAEANGLTLHRCSSSHYQLAPGDGRWLLNIYPGNCRLYHDRNMTPPPYVQVPTPWTLADVVRGMIAALEKGGGRR